MNIKCLLGLHRYRKHKEMCKCSRCGKIDIDLLSWSPEKIVIKAANVNKAEITHRN